MGLYGFSFRKLSCKVKVDVVVGGSWSDFALTVLCFTAAARVVSHTCSKSKREYETTIVFIIYKLLKHAVQITSQ